MVKNSTNCAQFCCKITLIWLGSSLSVLVDAIQELTIIGCLIIHPDVSDLSNQISLSLIAMHSVVLVCCCVRVAIC